jgi:hypothetical protein
MALYYFIENKSPTTDTNIDLNFENDILYNGITDDDLSRFDIPYVASNNVRPLKKGKKSKQSTANNKKTNSSNYIYILFIAVVIFVILFWYIYANRSIDQNIPIINTYASAPELTMLSPDFGMGSRYGIN